MNYQKLMIWILGLIFVLELSSEGSAMYDPALGRFCSRDPIGMPSRNTRQLYAFNDSRCLTRIDPSGMISVEIPEKNKTGNCGETLTASLDFKLSVDAACDGYLIQQVIVTCEGSSCPCTMKDNTKIPKSSYTYWEAIEIPKDTKADTVLTDGTNPNTDKVFADSVKDRCGKYKQATSVKFACKKSNLHPNGVDLSTWASGEVEYGGKSDCGKTKGAPLSSDKDAAKAIFKNIPIGGTEIAAFTDRTFSWCCCGDKDKDFFKVSLDGGTYNPN